MDCRACGQPRYMGPKPSHADQFVCRECQKSPAVQMRVLLAVTREQGMDFDRAWGWAFDRVKWPHDTTHRLDWKEVLSAPGMRETYQAAYYRRATGRRSRSVSHLVAAA